MENLTKAIISVMSEVKNIWKNTTVWTGGNSYKAVWDADVKKAIRESMEKNWLSIVCTWVTSRIKLDRWEEETQKYGSQDTIMKTKQSVFTEVDTTYLLMHISWESQVLAWYGQWVDSQDKGAGKATTYALKNTLINTFLVPTGEDTDNTHSDDIAVPQKKYNNEKRGLMEVINDMKSATTVEDRVKFKDEWKTFAKSEKQIKWLSDEWNKLG